LYLYLLTGPHTLAYHVPGLYLVGRQALREGLRLSPQEFSRALANLAEHAGLKADFCRSVLWLPSALDHMGPPANPNIVRGYVRAIQSMPKSPLRSDAIAAYGPFFAAMGPSFFEPFADGFPEVSQTVSKPFSKEKRQKYIEKRQAGSRPIGSLATQPGQEPQAVSEAQLPAHENPSHAGRANEDHEPPGAALNYEQNADHARQLWTSLAQSKA
jgi:hypothetical protein